MMEEDDNQHQLEVFQLELCRMQDAKRALEVEVFQLEQSHQYWRIRALERENQILSGDGTMQDAKRALEEAQQAGRAAEKRAKNVERMLRKKELMWEKERSELTKAAEERISQAEEKAKLAELRALDAQQFLEMLLAQQRRNLDGHCLEWQQTKRRLNEDRVTLFVNTREVFQADIDAPHDDDDDDDDDFPVSDEDLPMNDDDNSGGERNCNSVVLPSRRRRKSKKPRTHDVCIHCYVITKRTCCAHSGGLKLSEARQLVMNMYPNLRLRKFVLCVAPHLTACIRPTRGISSCRCMPDTCLMHATEWDATTLSAPIRYDTHRLSCSVLQMLAHTPKKVVPIHLCGSLVRIWTIQQ
jgi:hypothetical protein